VGILLTVTVLATAGRPGQPGPGTGNACVICLPRGDQDDLTGQRADWARSGAASAGHGRAHRPREVLVSPSNDSGSRQPFA
jgi:hypothetical protein